ncbi:hypothetical protein KP509_16G053200 [Ceratopteris richardii]|uniref:Uncharacterized protein n=1 Tax=Ceratopteris richardii TaxID=49495 RepID=A0A8T2T2I6_CERRI|nr:hypothetical protein KP509_16G053200 [Ceratopteris richardii]
MALNFPANRAISQSPFNAGGCVEEKMASDHCSEASKYGDLLEKGWPPGVLDPFALISFKETTIDDSQSFRSSVQSLRAKLPVVLEESESFSSRDGSSVGSASSTSLFSFARSSASSSRPFVRNDASTNKSIAKKGSKKPRQYSNDDSAKKLSVISLIFWPLRKLRDKYVSCMMGLDGNGDLSGLA